MSEFDLKKWSLELTKWLATIHHGDRICEQRGECTCGRDITVLKIQAVAAVMMNVYDEQKATIKGYEMALDEVFKAYPVDIFPETTKAEIDEVAERYPGFIDRTSAGMGRHIARVIRERAAHFAKELLEDL